MKTATQLKLTGATSRLERNVQRWANERGEDYDNGAEGVLKDLMYGGCASGMVGRLIHTADCVRFFATHRRDISDLLAEYIDQCGIGGGVSDIFGDKWDNTDPLAQEDENRNLLAWFGFEEAARQLAQRNGIEL